MSTHGILRCIALIVDPLAGGGRALRSLPVLEDYLRAEGITYELFQGLYPASLDAFTDLLILGGDGTVNHLLNHFPDIRIPIGVIPAGSGNDLAVMVSGSRDIRQCIETAVHGSTRWLDAGRCNGRIFMNCLGVGFDGEVADDIARVRLTGNRCWQPNIESKYCLKSFFSGYPILLSNHVKSRN